MAPTQDALRERAVALDLPIPTRLSHIALLESTPLGIPAVQKMMNTSSNSGHSLLTNLRNEVPIHTHVH